jgi:hypothetical protein
MRSKRLLTLAAFGRLFLARRAQVSKHLRRTCVLALDLSYAGAEGDPELL